MFVRPRGLFARLVILAALVAGIAGCTNPKKSGRVLVLGFDGMDPRAVDALAAEGKLPNFARLRARGAYAPLRSAKPFLSPVLWTTLATGKTPDVHGITHFTAISRTTGESLPVTASMRRVKALWNIFSDAQKSVAVVGYWATWPAEPVRGSIVSDHAGYHFLFREGLAAKPASPGLVYPASLEAEIRPLLRRAEDLSVKDLAPFADVSSEELARPFSFHDEVAHLRWAIATALGYRDVGMHLWRREQPDLGIVYFEGTDSVAHLFGHLFRARGLAGELAEQQRRYGGAVERMYVLADEILGSFMAEIDDRTTLVVVSDHGFELGALPDDPSKSRDLRRVSEEYHAPYGVLFLYGRGVVARATIRDPNLLDVAPTVLALAGLPKARDMTGRVLSEALTIEVPDEIATYETGRASTGELVADPTADPELMEKLRSLGYLGGPGSGDDAAPSAAADRNMAAILFDRGRLEESERAYAALVRQDPSDGALRASRAGVLGALGRDAEAMAEVDEAIRLQPINPEAHHNRGVLLERAGRPREAIAEYQAALSYQPGYEPSRHALLRLGVSSSTPRTPATEAEQKARVLCERAADAARHGDYASAAKLIDQAEGLAPRYALIQQYRSNVAYLAGDLEGAIAALERGLVLDPKNALFRENLRRLRASAAGARRRP